MFVALFLVVILLGPRMLNVDGDLPRHLTLGGYILDSRSIPRHDLFSHTLLGAPLTIHEWLTDVLFALIYRAMGLDGIVLLSAVVIALTSASSSARRSVGLARLSVSLALVMIAAAASSLHLVGSPSPADDATGCRLERRTGEPGTAVAGAVGGSFRC